MVLNFVFDKFIHRNNFKFTKRYKQNNLHKEERIIVNTTTWLTKTFDTEPVRTTFG